MTNLTPLQSQNISTFQSITETSYETALEYLVRWEWNLEVAVQNYYNTFHPVSSSSTNTTTTNTTTNTNINTNTTTNTANTNTTPGNTRRGILGLLGLGLSWTFDFLVSILKSTFTFVFGKPLYSDTLHLQGSLASQTVINTFETFYGTRRPNFFQGSYSQALDKGKRESKWILILLYHPQHQDTHAFCSNILTSSTLIDFLDSKRGIVWIGDMRTMEAHKVSQVLDVQAFPFSCLIAPQGAQMKVFDKIQGYYPLETYLQILQSFVSKVETHLSSLTRARQERETSRSIREEQDEAFKASLLADQEKARLAQIAQEELKKQELQIKELQNQQLNALEKKKLKIESLKSNLRPEPSLGSEQGPMTILNIRLPSGERVKRRFLQKDTIQMVQDFIETLNLDPIPFESDVILVNTYPRILFTNLTITLEEAKLIPNASLIVEEKLDVE